MGIIGDKGENRTVAVVLVMSPTGEDPRGVVVVLLLGGGTGDGNWQSF